MTYEFQDALDAQRQLQVKAYGYDPVEMPQDEKIEFIRWNILALEDELHEAIAEVGWKPWATSRHINREAFRGELVDAFHFLMNLMLVVDIDAEEFLSAYRAKREKNAKRQAAGYDGVSGKCAGCSRALDDDAVSCTETECKADWEAGEE